MRFRPNATQRRTWNRGQRVFRTEFGPLRIDQTRIDLFNRHRLLRGLDRGRTIDTDDYSWGFARSCFDSFEICFYVGDQLSGLAICDRGKTALSAVYTFFDPNFGRFSPGVYSILTQVDFCLRNTMRYVYLGFFIADCVHMTYKQNFMPHERLIGGRWIEMTGSRADFANQRTSFSD